MSENSPQPQEEEMSFGDLLEQSLQEDSIRPGDTVDGTVLAVNRDHVVVDIGAKSEGIVPLTDFETRAGELPREIAIITYCT